MADPTTRSIIEHNFLFRGLPSASIETLAGLAHRHRYTAGTLIFSQGDDGDALYGVASGQVRIYTSDDKGHEVFLTLLGPGEAFGEIALLDGEPRTASAVTTAPTTLVVIPRIEFLAHLARDPELSANLMKLLCERLRRVSTMLDEAAFLAGAARVAKRLTDLVETYGRPAPEGGVEVAMSQSDLGHFLGVSRQVINQYLRQWCEQGWVELKRGRIVVHDLNALLEVVSGPQ